MKSKDYLKQIAESKGVCPLTNVVKDNALLFPIGFEYIFKDLDRLEEFEKVLNGHCCKCVNRENNICVGMNAPIHIDTLINCIEMLSTELQMENKDLKEENAELKKSYNDLYNDIISVIQEVKNLVIEEDGNNIEKNNEELFKAIRNIGWNEAIDIISTKLAIRMSTHILGKINLDLEKKSTR